MTEQACVHLRVLYMSVTDWKGMTHGWWQCEKCEAVFVPEAELARLQELVEKQRAALDDALLHLEAAADVLRAALDQPEEEELR